jgi:MFS family permease
MAKVDSSAPQSDPGRLLNPMKPQVRGYLGATLIILLLPLLLLPFPVEPALITFSFLVAALVALSMAMSAAVCAYCAWRIGRRLRRFQEGDYLVCWTYKPEEWQAFAEAEAGRTRRAAAKAPLLGLWLSGLTGLTLGGSAGYVFYKQPPTVLVGALLGAATLGLVGAVIGWIVRSFVRGRAGRVRRRVLASPRTAYIGRDAVYCAGQYGCWTAYSSRLADLRLLDDQSTLEVTIHTRMQYTKVEQRFRVPVPAGRHDEAVRLTRSLSPR